jgi:hypothetical protein
MDERGAHEEVVALGRAHRLVLGRVNGHASWERTLAAVLAELDDEGPGQGASVVELLSALSRFAAVLAQEMSDPDGPRASEIVEKSYRSMAEQLLRSRDD